MQIISLTSIPSRFPELYEVLGGLLKQQADEVWLAIPLHYRRFPDWDGSLPKVPPGIKILRPEIDYGPATKVLAAVSELKGHDAQILFCDDDATRSKGWSRTLFAIQAERPDEAVAGYVRAAEGYVPNKVTPLKTPQAFQRWPHEDYVYRALRLMHKMLRTPHPLRRPFKKSGYGEIFFGTAGVVVRSQFFDETAFAVPEEAWFVDDVWLSAQLARKSIPVYCPKKLAMPVALEGGEAADALVELSIGGKNRYELNCQAAIYCRDKFGIWNK